jgi:ABC-type bacteriocin/lantibiotic exporter with double-glycine peptidase domain
MEAIERIKTVHHLNCQDIFIDRFEAATLRQLNTDVKVLLIQVTHHTFLFSLPRLF